MVHTTANIACARALTLGRGRFGFHPSQLLDAVAQFVALIVGHERQEPENAFGPCRRVETGEQRVYGRLHRILHPIVRDRSIGTPGTVTPFFFK